ncbi:MAG: hypothetical protein QOF41_2705 [Methylobacteriaceae bacterium]|nr:hypothetical protein [Methylobacteriaceae bacterium]
MAHTWSIGALPLLAALGACSVAFAAEKPVRFWNLTSATVTELRLAPAGSDKFGPDQCKNDKDGSIDHDERLPITAVAPGRYDIKIGYKDGKSCRVPNVSIESGKVFSIEDKDLKDCSAAAR